MSTDTTWSSLPTRTASSARFTCGSKGSEWLTQTVNTFLSLGVLLALVSLLLDRLLDHDVTAALERRRREGEMRGVRSEHVDDVRAAATSASSDANAFVPSLLAVA